jgi:hypothetical protein
VSAEDFGPDGEVSGEVIFEIRRVGAIQRVAAIHVASGVEVVIQAPESAALADVQALAVRKLKRVLSGGSDAEISAAPTPGRGKLI